MITISVSGFRSVKPAAMASAGHRPRRSPPHSAGDDKAVEGAGAAIDEVAAVVGDLDPEGRGDSPVIVSSAGTGEDEIVAGTAFKGIAGAIPDKDVAARIPPLIAEPDGSLCRAPRSQFRSHRLPIAHRVGERPACDARVGNGDRSH